MWPLNILYQVRWLKPRELGQILQDAPSKDSKHGDDREQSKQVDQSEGDVLEVYDRHHVESQGRSHEYQDHPELRRTHPPVTELEDTEHMRFEVYVDRQEVEADQARERDRQEHVRRQSQADADGSDREHVGEMVEVEPVAGPLDVPHSSQSSIEAVSQPVHDPQCVCNPQVGYTHTR